jgi:hypothetical protein
MFYKLNNEHARIIFHRLILTVMKTALNLEKFLNNNIQYLIVNCQTKWNSKIKYP